MDDQLTLRIPAALARGPTRRARERGVPKSQLVREALRGYLAAGAAESPDSSSTESSAEPREIIERFRGSAPLDRAALESDALARQIRAHNWRS